MNSNILKPLVVALAALSLWPAAALCQSWPAKPIRLLVPFPAGGGVDYIGRIVGKGLSERLGQQVVIDNRPSAGGIVGTQMGVQAQPDGYTMVMVSVHSRASPAATTSRRKFPSHS